VRFKAMSSMSEAERGPELNAPQERPNKVTHQGGTWAATPLTGIASKLGPVAVWRPHMGSEDQAGQGARHIGHGWGRVNSPSFCPPARPPCATGQRLAALRRRRAPKGNKNALKHGDFTAESRAVKKQVHALARMARATLMAIE
jgi:hypothetical protein